MAGTAKIGCLKAETSMVAAPCPRKAEGPHVLVGFDPKVHSVVLCLQTRG